MLHMQCSVEWSHPTLHKCIDMYLHVMQALFGPAGFSWPSETHFPSLSPLIVLQKKIQLDSENDD